MNNFNYFRVLFVLPLAILFSSPASAQQSIVKRDNGVAGGVHNFVGREASVILEPEGPCRVVALQIYFPTNTPASDTIWIVGDAAAGTVPPTSWVWPYNTLIPPFVIQYDGVPGWKEYTLSEMNLRIDGYDRVVVQHRIDPNGLLWGVDNSSQSTPYSSFLMDPTQNNSLGFLGVYQLAGGDFMVRLVVEYEYPEGEGSAEPPTPTMVDVTESAGLLDGGNSVPSSRVSVVDWNNDGWDDVAAGSRFWQNNGNGTFTKVDLGITASASVWGDYDNDGDLDCYAARGGTNDDFLYRNNGDGTFTDVTAESGLSNPAPTVTPIWFDFNHDANLDLFISNGRTGDFPNEIFYKDKLWLNNGDGTFTDVTETVGIAIGEPDPNTDCWGAAAGDYNQDGATHIFVAAYRLAPDLLYRNNGGESFTEIARSTGVIGEPTADPQYFGHGIGVEWADYNNDGLVDLTVGNLGHPDWRGQVSNPSLVYRNEGGPDYHFTEVHHDLGVKFFELNAGVVWGDFDLDGYQDLFHCHYSYSNEGASGEPARLSRLYFNGGPDEAYHLNDRTWETGLRTHGAWTAARLDYDRDGDLDLIVATPREKLTLYRNDLPRKGTSIVVRLRGQKESGIPEDGYGTKVIIHNGSQLYFRELAGGGSGATGTQNSNALHFGLGNVPSVDSLVVEWGDGTRQKFESVETGREYRVEYGSSELEEVFNPLTVDEEVGWRGESGSRFQVVDFRYDDETISFNFFTRQSLAAEVEVLNTVGERLLFYHIEKGEGNRFIELPALLPAGVYFVRFSDGRSEEIVKLSR